MKEDETPEVLMYMDKNMRMHSVSDSGMSAEECHEMGIYSREGGCWLYNWVENGEAHQRVEASKHDMF